MAEKLTIQQQMAVDDRGGMLLVSAAAGSGKTKVLVDRLMKYLTDEKDPANIDEFLIITYTKAAAAELRAKIGAKLTERIAAEPENKHLQKQMQRLYLTKISTVHGFCSDLLREYAYRLDLNADFRVADENECREMRELSMQAVLEQAYDDPNADFRAFVDTQGIGRDDRQVPTLVEKVFDAASCHKDPKAWLADCLRACEVSHVHDASETIWGQCLIEDMKQQLSAQIHVLERSVMLLERMDNMEKPIMNLKTTLNDMYALDKCQTWDEIHENRDITYGTLRFPKKIEDQEIIDRIKATRNDGKAKLAKVLGWFSEASEQVLADLKQGASVTAGLIDLVGAFARAYSTMKKSRKCLDFSDLEHRTLDLLLGKSRTSPTAVAGELGARFREVLVDEYQDSNEVQDAIFGALTEKRKNCFMVGDVKQSIYQFRLADPSIFLKKYQSYADVTQAEHGEGRRVLLSDNFRSGPEVIEAVNHVFASCMSPRVGGLTYGEGEALREGIVHKAFSDTAVELHAVETTDNTYAEEAAFVASRIDAMLKDGTTVRDGDGFRPVTADDIVILLRTPSKISAYYERALASHGIRCASGGGEDLLKTDEVVALRAILQTVYNPREDIALLSALMNPVFGFTADDLAAIRSAKKKGNIYESLLTSDSPKVQEFLDILRQLREQARMDTLTKLIEKCITLTHIDSIYGAMDGGQLRREHLQAFYALAADYEAGDNRSLGEFLAHLDALAVKGLTVQGASASGCVTIMSIHKSKGLEFPVVFVAGLAKAFNRQDLNAPILCDKKLGIGLDVTDPVARIHYPSIAKRAISAKFIRESASEELRVLYVALTRARDRLIMVYASRYLETKVKNVALSSDLGGGALLCEQVSCMGTWVLKAAMERTEAGELFAICRKLDDTSSSEHPWKITVSTAPRAEPTRAEQAQTQEEHLDDATVKTLRDSLAFRYAHTSATITPSKQTATQRKGREKDEEVAENTSSPKQIQRTWRKPSFVQAQMAGKAYGSALHSVMQYIRYAACDSEAGVAREVERLVQEGFIREDVAQVVNCASIATFFATPIGRSLQQGAEHLREFKFSILDDASHYGADLAGEKVLLQGVVDCALIEPDGITVLDFKTDHVTEETLPTVTQRYAPQVQTYADALERIYEMPVKKKLLYFFYIGQFVEVT